MTSDQWEQPVTSDEWLADTGFTRWAPDAFMGYRINHMPDTHFGYPRPTDEEQAMTLTEFLLARIAEDEANAWRWCEDVGGGDWEPLKARVLAECEAKRRIVEIHQDGGESQGYLEDGYADIPHCCNACGEFGEYGVPWPCGTIKALALPYVDHPDYRPEWKP